MKKNIKEILLKLKNELPYLEDKYEVKSLQPFGSYVRNEQKRDSDLDILVVFANNPSLLKFLELENYLGDKLGVKIDLVIKNALKPRLRKIIINEAVSL